MEIRERLYNFACGASASFSNWSNIEISPEEFISILVQHEKYWDYILDELESYPDSYLEPVGGLDTCVRDLCFDVVAQHVTGKCWPTYSEIREGFHQTMVEYFAKSE
jgi:hypothetical protein